MAESGSALSWPGPRADRRRNGRIVGASGRAMLEALIAGADDPAVLADLSQRRLRDKIPQLVDALTGRFTAHHGLLART